MRIGTKKRPFYRVVAVDERKKRTGAYLENLGTYNPLTSPKEIILKQDRIDDWIKKGAVLSDGYLRIIGKAKQHPIRPAKKQKKEAPSPAPVSVEAESNKTSESVETTQQTETPDNEVNNPQTDNEAATESNQEETPENPEGESSEPEVVEEKSEEVKQ